MSCPYHQCAHNTIHRNCRYSKDPKTCAYGKYMEELKTAYQNGFSACFNNTPLMTIIGHRIKRLIGRILKWVRLFCLFLHEG